MICSDTVFQIFGGILRQKGEDETKWGELQKCIFMKFYHKYSAAKIIMSSHATKRKKLLENDYHNICCEPYLTPIFLIIR